MTTVEYGFDLTSFPNAAAWEKLCEEFKLSLRVQRDEREPFVWHAEHGELLVVTCNNPITGEYYRKGQRANEVGYASYMGLTGERERVRACALRIHKLADYIKGFNRSQREFV